MGLDSGSFPAIFSAVTESLTIQGRPLSPDQLQGLRQWVEGNPQWSRWRLSRELAARWDWRNGAGLLKDMAARTLLVKLEQRGLLQRRATPGDRRAYRVVLTPAARQLLRQILPDYYRLAEQVWDDLPEARVSRLLADLSHLDANLAKLKSKLAP